jgi:hypothetical protein
VLAHSAPLAGIAFTPAKGNMPPTRATEGDGTASPPNVWFVGEAPQVRKRLAARQGHVGLPVLRVVLAVDYS